MCPIVGVPTEPGFWNTVWRTSLDLAKAVILISVEGKGKGKGSTRWMDGWMEMDSLIRTEPVFDCRLEQRDDATS